MVLFSTRVDRDGGARLPRGGLRPSGTSSQRQQRRWRCRRRSRRLPRAPTSLDVSGPAHRELLPAPMLLRRGEPRRSASGGERPRMSGVRKKRGVRTFSARLFQHQRGGHCLSTVYLLAGGPGGRALGDIPEDYEDYQEVCGLRSGPRS